MRRYILVLSVGFVSLISLAAPQIRADGVDTFTFSVPSLGILEVWQLPASPTPITSNIGEFTVEAEVTGINPSETLVSLIFSASGGSPTNLSGGLDEPAYGVGFHTSDGRQVFSGATGSPTFIPGTYVGFWDASGQDFTPATLTITTSSATPEPSALLLLAAGLAGLFCMSLTKRVS